MNTYIRKKGTPNDFGEEERKMQLTASEKKKKQVEEKKALNATKDWRSIAKNWDLNNPPSERHSFWSIRDPKIKYEALIHYVHTNQKVTIPYDYVAIGYSLWKGQEKYVPKVGQERPTVTKVLNELNEILESEHYKAQPVDPNQESIIRYTPKITAWNQRIATLDGNLNKNKQQILTCKNNMKGRRLKDRPIQTKLAILLKRLNHKKKTLRHRFEVSKQIKKGFIWILE